jgi:hypothetical protein
LGCKPIECVLRIIVQLDVASEDAIGGERRHSLSSSAVSMPVLTRPA